MKVPVDECPAGRAMDAAVATSLGWEQKGEGAALSWRMLSGELRTREETSFRSFRPSEDIAAAWELAELCKHGPFYVGWSASWGVPYCMLGDIYVYADTVPLAASRAFLKANGVTEIEMPDEQKKKSCASCHHWKFECPETDGSQTGMCRRYSQVQWRYGHSCCPEHLFRPNKEETYRNSLEGSPP